jgi:hypothetical protein
MVTAFASGNETLYGKSGALATFFLAGSIVINTMAFF